MNIENFKIDSCHDAAAVIVCTAGTRMLLLNCEQDAPSLSGDPIKIPGAEHLSSAIYHSALLVHSLYPC